MSKYQQSSLFIKRLGLEYPIIQSPMAGISTIKLASVISSNGGLGSIPLASVDARKQSGIDSIDKQLNEFKSLAKTNVVNVNFFAIIMRNNKHPLLPKLKIGTSFWVRQVQVLTKIYPVYKNPTFH